MLSRHLQYALRLFKKDLYYNLLNIGGLAIGLAAGILVILILRYDFEYDKYNTKHERIYRYVQTMEAPGVKFDVAVSSKELASVIQETIPGIEATVRFEFLMSSVVSVPSTDEKFIEERIFKTDSTVFDVFSINIVEGSANKALSGKNSAVINQTLAKKFFKDESAIGKEIQLPDSSTYIVNAVMEDLPPNTHMVFDILLSGIELPKPIDDMQASESYWNPNVYTFLLFEKNADPSRFLEEFDHVYDKTYKRFGEQIDGKVTPELERLDQIHFQSGRNGDFPQGNTSYMYASGAIGILIVLLACINYINLTTARSAGRAQEISMRKVLGISKTSLHLSILVETALLVSLAFLFAIGLALYFTESNEFNAMIGRSLSIAQLISSTPYLLGLFILVILLSGFYPAIYIAAQPVLLFLKGNKTTSSGGTGIRKVLIGLQFILSITVIITTILMGAQINFMKSEELGFTKDNVIIINLKNQRSAEDVKRFEQMIGGHHTIKSVSSANSVPGDGLGDQVFKVETADGMAQQHFKTIYADEKYLDVLGLELKEGRSFDVNKPTDQAFAFIVNEAAVRQLGWDSAAVGKHFTYFHEEQLGQVIGVIKDFNFTSLHNSVEPMVIVYNPNNSYYMLVRTDGKNISGTVDFLSEQWKAFEPDQPFEYSFIDDLFAEQYEADQLQYKLISLLSVTCILLSLLGLVGLAAFSAQQRTKEIAVRKTMGASTMNILTYFSKEYVKLILLATVLAIPLANFIATEWMKQFAYQMQVKIWYFILPSVGVLLVALITVAIQSLKAARTNPVSVLSAD